MLFKDEEDKVVSYLKEFLIQDDLGIAFSLVMRDETGKLSFHERIHQPCWGELRKYKKTHGDECTKPIDTRPSDLFHPFPKGIPEALGIHMNTETDYCKFLLSDNSPWVRGFGSNSNILIYDFGFILLDTSIDPTVLVNLLRSMSRGDRFSKRSALFDSLIKKGLSPIQALFPVTFTGLDSCYESYTKMGVPPPDTYSNSVKVDVKRFLAKNPHDLTGGTLRDRCDYDRKNLAKIFYDPQGLNFVEELNKRIRHTEYMIQYSSSPFYKIDEQSVAEGTVEVLYNEYVSKLPKKGMTWNSASVVTQSSF